jgi:hypothetical protein
MILKKYILTITLNLVILYDIKLLNTTKLRNLHPISTNFQNLLFFRINHNNFYE